MALIEHYAALRQVHITLVAASGGWFALRALAHAAGAGWPLARTARVTSWLIDSGLLAAGVTLWIALRLGLWPPPWLAAKLILLLAYIGLGTMALRRARGPVARLAWTLAALGCFGLMGSVAVAHHPLGVFALR